MLHQLSSWQVQVTDVEVLGRYFYGYGYDSAVVRSVGCTAKFLETLTLAYHNKMNISYQTTALENIAVVNMLIAHTCKSCDICGNLLLDKTAHFRMAFYCVQTKAPLYTYQALRSEFVCAERFRSTCEKLERNKCVFLCLYFC